jgi:hypothetical protein
MPGVAAAAVRAKKGGFKEGGRRASAGPHQDRPGGTSMTIARRSALGLALAGLAAPALVQAQGSAWRPTRPMRLIVPFAPGGSNDIVGRIIAEPAGSARPADRDRESRRRGQRDRRRDAARSPPDGYTLLINSAHATVPAIVARMPYDMR